ncbi:DUF1955 domain-containing protein, partial [Acidianus sp. RZ1]
MGADKRELIKSLTEAKELILDGYLKQGIDLIEKTVTSDNIKESNWVICNIIDAVPCQNLVTVLDNIGKMFDISVCGNVKRVISCYSKVNKYNELVDIAIDSIVQKRKVEQLDKVLQELGNNGMIYYKLALAYEKLNYSKKAQELKKKACENGIAEA